MAIAETMPAMEKRWKEENDVRTLAEAEKIKGDRTRLNPAKKRAKVMAREAQKEANAVKKVATGLGKTTIKGGTRKKTPTTRKRK